LQAATKNGADTFNPRIFLDNLPKKPEFDVIFQNKKAYQQIKDISVGLKRISKFQPMRYNSKTAQRLQADEDSLGDSVKIAKELSKGKFSVLWDKIKNATKNSYNQRIAEIMLSPIERDEVLKLVGKETEKNNTASYVSRAISSTLSMN